jgi:hypothetical protein
MGRFDVAVFEDDLLDKRRDVVRWTLSTFKNPGESL